MKAPLFLSVTASAIALMATPAAAQTAQSGAAAGASNELGDIVVTARRVEEKLQDVPVAITAISASQLEARKVGTVSDIQFSVPNLQIKPSNLEPSRPEFIIRGQRQVLYTDENVVTYVNGVPQTTRGLTLYDLDSVQALKGPQGTLFGKNSLGGAMVFATKRPVFRTEASVAVEVGNYDRKQVNAMINVPLGDKVALRAVGQIERQDGFFKNLQPGMQDLANRHNESFRVSLLVAPSERFENLFVADYIHRDEIPAPSQIEAAPSTSTGGSLGGIADVTRQAVLGLTAAGGGTATVLQATNASGYIVQRGGNPYVSLANTGRDVVLHGPGVFYNGARSTQYTGGEVYGFANVSTFEASDSITLKNIIGYRHEDVLDQQDPSGITGQVYNLAGLGLPLSGPATNFDTHQRRVLDQFSNEFQIIGKTDNLKWIAGAYYSFQKRHLDSNSSGIFGPFNFQSRREYTVDFTATPPFIGSAVRPDFSNVYGDPLFIKYDNFNDRSRSLAAFAQGTYDFTSAGLKGVSLTAGIRYTSDRRNFTLSPVLTDVFPMTKTYQNDPAHYFCRLLPGTTPDPAGTNSVAVNSGSTCLQSAGRTYNALSWNASLEWRANNNVLAYVATRRGFKAGGPNFSTLVQQYDMFGSEKLTDVELGLKTSGTLGTMPFRLNIAGFYGWYKQIQTQDILQFCSVASDPSSSCSFITDLIVFNVGGATIKGFELDGAIKPIPQLELSFGYSYQVGRYSKGSVVPQPTIPNKPIANDNPINFGSGTDLSGVEFAGMPRNTLTIAGTFTADFIPESFAKTALNVNYYYRSATKGLSVQGIYKTPSFSTTNVRLSFDDLFGTQFSAAFWMQNVFNNKYRLSCADNLNSIGYATCKWGDPRTYGVTASVKF